MFLFCSLGIAAALAFIPANIAKDKGYSFGLWWFYGWMLFVVAIVHVHLIPDRNTSGKSCQSLSASIPYCPPSQLSAAEELSQYKQLLDQGVISSEEFEKKKQQILGV